MTALAPSRLRAFTLKYEKLGFQEEGVHFLLALLAEFEIDDRWSPLCQTEGDSEFVDRSRSRGVA